MKHGHIEKLIATDYRLFTLQTTAPEKIVKSFRYFSRTGRAAYVWEDTRGLSRLEASHITLPNTETPLQVLNYIQNSRHFGIYLLKGFNRFMKNDELQSILKQLADKKTDKTRNSEQQAVIFLDSAFKLPEKLLSHFLMTQEPAERR